VHWINAGGRVHYLGGILVAIVKNVIGGEDLLYGVQVTTLAEDLLVETPDSFLIFSFC